jgi:transposase
MREALEAHGRRLHFAIRRCNDREGDRPIAVTSAGAPRARIAGRAIVGVAINDIFAADALLADLAAAQRKVRRDAEVRPLVNDFFAWAKTEKTKLTGRGLVATAIAYALNHEDAFRRFLEDGRLLLENNRAERALRSIATARKSWRFFGSDDHASAAANLFSLVASCKLHGLDVEAYLADVIRVMPYWPPDRYVEFAPKYWSRTRARLDAEEMKLPLGHVTVPPPLAAEEQAATS